MITGRRTVWIAPGRSTGRRWSIGLRTTTNRGDCKEFVTATIDGSQPAPEQGGSGFAGLRVCSFESRKGAEMRGLIERHGGSACIAPSMREIPLEQNSEALAFAERLLAGSVDVVILLTGVGTRALAEAVASRFDRNVFLDALQKCTIIVRGPKPAGVLRELKIRFEFQVPEPNTWRELLALVDDRVPIAGKTVAVQEYGQPNPELYSGLAARGAEVVRVPVYRWALPEDTAPLIAAIRAIIAGEVDVLMFTSAYQLNNVLAAAAAEGLRDEWLAAARKCVVASIGPTATENLELAGLPVDLQPEHPKMGHLVLESAREARRLLQTKR